MSDLADRVLAAIEETERTARFVKDAGLGDELEWSLIASATISSGPGIDHTFGTGNRNLAQHIIHHDPAAVLRRCAADREIVANYQEAARELKEAIQRAETTQRGGGFEHAANMERVSRKQIKHATLSWVIHYLARGYGITEEES